MIGRRPGYGALIVALLSVIVITGAVPVVAGTEEDAAQRAADEIAAARGRANAAAAAFADAETELSQLSDRAEDLQRDEARLEREVVGLRSQVEQVALNRYMSSGTNGIPLLTGYGDPSDQLQAAMLTSIVTESSADAIDQFAVAQSELEATQQDVATNRTALQDQQEELTALQQAALDEVARLQEVEAERLADERVQQLLLERQRRELDEERQRQIEESETTTTTIAPDLGADPPDATDPPDQADPPDPTDPPVPTDPPDAGDPPPVTT
ncbi:MAG: hypothetical protein H0U21_04065, partial [Acidimicrobiia bacterium]|nr:hypothetical protein [Acidimicrobiia bacterium]